MKGKFAKILGVGLALVMVLALAAPVMADVTEPEVDVGEPFGTATISTWTDYTVTFAISKQLDVTDESEDYIEVRFPDDTEIAKKAGHVFDGVVKISATVGLGSDDFDDKVVAKDVEVDGRTITISLKDFQAQIGWDEGDDIIGRFAELTVEFSGKDIRNPSVAEDYTLEVRTSAEDEWIESESYTIRVPAVGGYIYVKNPAGVTMAAFGGTDALDDCVLYFAEDDYTIEVGPGTFILGETIEITGEGLKFISTDGAEATIIDATDVDELGCSTPVINIWADDVVVDGFTIEDAPGRGIQTLADGTIIQDNIIEVEALGINLCSDKAIVSGNIIDDCWDGIYLTGGADDCTIEGNKITGSRATSEGAITFEGACLRNIVRGNIITDNDGSGIFFWFDGDDENLIEDNTISENDGSGILIGADVTDLVITGNNIITDNEASGIFFGAGDVEGLEIRDNTITGNEDDGISFEGTVMTVKSVINGNDISSNEENGIRFAATADVEGLVLTGNDIADNGNDIDADEEVGILIDCDSADWEATNVIGSNNITGNEDYGLAIGADVGATYVYAALNWWGASVAADIAAMIDIDAAATDVVVVYEPFLTDPWEDVFEVGQVKLGADSLDAKTAVGVRVSGVIDADTKKADVISAVKYLANPTGAVPEYTPVVFYDVYIALNAAFDIDETVTIILKLYASGVTASTRAQVWSEVESNWVTCSNQEPSIFGGYVRVSITEESMPTIEELTGTAFVVVEGPPAAPVLFELTAPEPGATTPVTNVPFTWRSVVGAASYQLVVSRYAGLTAAVVSEPTIGTAYTYTGTLAYSTPYYWQVTVLDEDGEEIAKSDVATFITESEPEAVVFVCQQCGLTFDTRAGLEAHIAEAHAPAAEVFTCPQCGLTFDTRAELATHIAAAHPPEAVIFVCPQCGLTFDTRAELAVHIAAAHPPVEPVAPEVTVEMPEITVEAADITVHPPDITVESPAITVESPDITVETPAITVEAPIITVEPPDITVEAPIVEVEIPAEEPALPPYAVWVIIAVGALLMVAVVVLIIRTRRVV